MEMWAVGVVVIVSVFVGFLAGYLVGVLKMLMIALRDIDEAMDKGD